MLNRSNTIVYHFNLIPYNIILIENNQTLYDITNIFNKHDKIDNNTSNNIFADLKNIVVRNISHCVN